MVNIQEERFTDLNGTEFIAWVLKGTDRNYPLEDAKFLTQNEARIALWRLQDLVNKSL